MMKAAQSGCKICKTHMLPRIKTGPDEAGERERDPFSTYIINPYYLKDFLMLTIKSRASWDKNVNSERPFLLQVRALQATPVWWNHFLRDARTDIIMEPWCVRKDCFPSRNIPGNTGDIEMAQLALHWLNDCRSNHGLCESMDEERNLDFYPPRLLEISRERFQTCRIINTTDKNPGNRKRYVALSHCWGKSPMTLTLTTANMDKMKEEIPWAKLPKSFQDAIQTCWRLGYLYIWIDSLCIIQSGPDFETDWQLHASMMDQIYTNCELAIAISHASDPTQGCFVNRDTDLLQTAFAFASVELDLKSLLEDPNGQYGTEAVDDNAITASVGDVGNNNSSSTSEDIVNKDYNTTVRNVVDDGSQSNQSSISHLITIYSWRDFDSHLERSPLQKRGWVYQERLLAPRLLHFGKNRTYWECDKTSLNEYLPPDFPHSGRNFGLRRNQPFSLPAKVLQSNPTTNLNENVQDLWLQIVASYSGRKLTFPVKDKLMAVSAIARRFGRVLPGGYTSGLFLSPSCYGLLWYSSSSSMLYRDCDDGCTETIFPDPKRGAEYRAPSW